jgi:ATP-dependent DNA helicase RecQ
VRLDELRDSWSHRDLDAATRAWGLRMIGRAAVVWQDPQAGPGDRLSALRQMCRLLGTGVRVDDLSEALVGRALDFALEVSRSPNGLIVRAREATALAQLFASATPRLFDARAEYRRHYRDARADPWTIRINHHDVHTHYAQRVAIRAAACMPAGGVLGVSLPTGAGKTQVGLLAIQATNSAAVVIVPTVALALDQVAQARKIFGTAQVRELIGDVGAPERKHALQELRDGAVRVIFVGPEMAIGSCLDGLQEAARVGRVAHLVVDEVHLAVDWGREFRPEFARLPELRARLLDESRGQLRTILLSATWSLQTKAAIRASFDSGPFRFIDAGALRGEHDYLALESAGEGERRDLVLQALRLGPRPAVVYVTSPEDADSYYDTLAEHGFRRVSVFSGNTVDSERRRIINEWRNDALDIVVGTSAFGVGIDKEDVRMVVHACLPETLDRYYQEVGRAGRDGFAAISVLALVKGVDRKEAARVGSSQSVENAIERIDPLYESSKPLKIRDGKVWRTFNLNAFPAHLRRTNDANRRWNRATLGWLERLELISVPVGSGMAEEAWEVVIERPDVLSQPPFASNITLRKLLEHDRDSRAAAASGQRDILQGVANRPEACLHDELATLYGINMTVSHCGRCPFCGYGEPIPLPEGPHFDTAWHSRDPAHDLRVWVEYLKDVPGEIVAAIICSGGSQILTTEQHAPRVLDAVKAASTGAVSPAFISTFDELRHGRAIAESLPTVCILDSTAAADLSTRAVFERWARRDEPLVNMIVLSPPQFRFDPWADLARHLLGFPLLSSDQFLSRWNAKGVPQ